MNQILSEDEEKESEGFPCEDIPYEGIPCNDIPYDEIPYDIKNIIDIPYGDLNLDSNIPSKAMLSEAEETEKRYNAEADHADRMDKHVYKKHGLKLLIGCGIGYILVVAADTVLGCFGLKISTLSTGLIELFKFIISTLIGFVFADLPKSEKK